jgi:predicted acylesterase/phospholipase RssA
METHHIAIACQGGGSHAAYTGGALPPLLEGFDNLALARGGRTDGGGGGTTLAAISGTSGGAISALLGWYGFITGGAQAAARRLDGFWQANSALGLAEAAVNRTGRALADAAALGGWDVKASPYAWPLAAMEVLGTTAWPALAGMLGPDNPWMRPDYFSLQELVRPRVDWPLVALLGEFASIPVEVERWLRSDLESAMFPSNAPCQDRYRQERGAVERRITARLDAPDRLRARMNELGIGTDTLLHAALADWHPPAVRFDADTLGALARAVCHALRMIPRLLLGAVELHDGEFMAFSSERAPGDGGITEGAVLASAAVPWLFRAQEMRGTDERTLGPRALALWDGLFSQNPPIRNFLAGVTDDAKKPDEIWVVQINPTAAKTVAGTSKALARVALAGGEIWDVRNALSGNLALNQELGFVDAINRRMEPARAGDPANVAAAARRRDKRVQIDRIVMDENAVEAAAAMPLGANSKLDRDPRLRAALWEHGQQQARRFLALRRQAHTLFADLDATLSGVCACAAGQPLRDGAGRTAATRPDGAARLGSIVVDGLAVHALGPDAGQPQALVNWRSVHTRVNGWPVRIEGETELVDGTGGADWQPVDVRITAVVPAPAAVAHADAAPAWVPLAGRVTPPPSETRH